MIFDFILYNSHDFEIIPIETILLFKIHCKKCNVYVSEYKLGYLAHTVYNVHYRNYLNCSMFSISLQKLNEFFQKFTCEELIIKNIIE